MLNKSVRVFLLVGLLLTGSFFFSLGEVTAQETEPTYVHMFGRDDCGHCMDEKTFLQDNGIPYDYYNIVESDSAKELYLKLAEKHSATKVTPYTVVGDMMFVGFDTDETTGQAIKRAIEKAKLGSVITPSEHVANAPAGNITLGAGCTDEECDSQGTMVYIFDLPFIGLTDLKTFSLSTLSVVLGVIDGFNPCAMWVLITFLVLLSQAGSKRKMVLLAGIFIMAEAIMYNLILNIWYKTWDFVSLDQIVTPLVGFLALGGGLFFIYRWHKNKGVALVCDISNIESQSKTIAKFQKIASQPITIATFAAILIIAFSVNIIEFACSIGIPQAYTKILDLNMLTFIERQWYILIYTIGYMVDDFIVFGLAIWGYNKLEAHGHKYSQASLIIGGLLMVLLGAVLVFKPDLLVL